MSVIRTPASTEYPLFPQASMSAAASPSRSRCMRKHRTTRRRTFSESVAMQPGSFSGTPGPSTPASSREHSRNHVPCGSSHPRKRTRRHQRPMAVGTRLERHGHVPGPGPLHWPISHRHKVTAGVDCDGDSLDSRPQRRSFFPQRQPVSWPLARAAVADDEVAALHLNRGREQYRRPQPTDAVRWSAMWTASMPRAIW